MREFENSIEAVATANKPKNVMEVKRPRKSKSIFLRSGKERYFSNNLLIIFHTKPAIFLNLSPLSL